MLDFISDLTLYILQILRNNFLFCFIFLLFILMICVSLMLLIFLCCWLSGLSIGFCFLLLLLLPLHSMLLFYICWVSIVRSPILLLYLLRNNKWFRLLLLLYLLLGMIVSLSWWWRWSFSFLLWTCRVCFELLMILDLNLHKFSSFLSLFQSIIKRNFLFFVLLYNLIRIAQVALAITICIRILISPPVWID